MKVFRLPLRRSWIRHWCGVFESTSTYVGGILTGLLTLLSAKRSLIGACVAFSWPDALPDVKPMVQSLSFPISLISSSLPHFPSWVLTSYLCNFATKNLISFWCTIYILPFFCDLPICVHFGVFIDPVFADPYGLILTPHAFSLQISKWARLQGHEEDAPPVPLFFYPMVYYNILIY